MPNKRKLLHNKHKKTVPKDTSREKKPPLCEPCTTTRAVYNYASREMKTERTPRPWTWTAAPPPPVGFSAPRGLTLQLFHDSSLDSSTSPLNGATSWSHHTQQHGCFLLGMQKPIIIFPECNKKPLITIFSVVRIRVDIYLNLHNQI